MYNPRKDFEKNVNKILGAFLKSNGFKSFKTRNYVRITTDYILQIVNFQKSAGFAYYINISSIPLANIQKSFFAEGGLRIQYLSSDFIHNDSSGRFEFGTEYLATQNLEELLDFFKSKAIYWFDLLGNSNTFLEYENGVEDQKQSSLRPLLKGSTMKELNYAFLQLQCEKYDDTHKYLESLNALIAEKNEHFYLNQDKEKINSLLTQINNSDFASIKRLIQENIEKNIENLSLGKFKLYKCPKISLNEYLAIKHVTNHKNLIPGNRGVEHYFHILNGDISIFENLKTRLNKEFQLVEISAFRFALVLDEKVSFHFVLNNYDFVKDDILEIYQWYGNKGMELKELENQKTRIEFWCDFPTRTSVTSPTKDKLIQIIRDKISNIIWMPGRNKFVEKQI